MSGKVIEFPAGKRDPFLFPSLAQRLVPNLSKQFGKLMEERASRIGRCARPGPARLATCGRLVSIRSGEPMSALLANLGVSEERRWPSQRTRPATCTRVTRTTNSRRLVKLSPYCRRCEKRGSRILAGKFGNYAEYAPPIDRPHWARFVAEKIKQLQSMARQKVKTDAAWIRRERKGEEIAILIITVMMYYRDDPATFIEMVAQALRGKPRDKYYDELLKKAFFQTMRKVSGRNDRFTPFNSEDS